MHKIPEPITHTLIIFAIPTSSETGRAHTTIEYNGFGIICSRFGHRQTHVSVFTALYRLLRKSASTFIGEGVVSFDEYAYDTYDRLGSVRQREWNI